MILGTGALVAQENKAKKVQNSYTNLDSSLFPILPVGVKPSLIFNQANNSTDQTSSELSP
jgi:hypothetical protein